MAGNLENSSGRVSDSKNLFNQYNEIIYIDFPKKYKRKWSQSFDKRFVIIWIVTFIVHVSLTYYFSTHLPAKEKNIDHIQQIQKQFARLVLKKENVEESENSGKNRIIPVAEKETPELLENQPAGESASSSGGRGSGSGEKAGKSSSTSTNKASRGLPSVAEAEKRASYTIPAGRSYRSPDRKSFRIISQNVSDKGILAFLGSTSSQASGSAVNDILQEVDKAKGEFTSTLNNVGGIKKGQSETDILSQREERVQRQTRSAEQADIGIQGREQVATAEFNRQQDFEKQNMSAINLKEQQNFGKRNPDDISAVVSKHNSSIQSCYQRELRRNPELKGKVVVRFTISPAGKVIRVELISSTLNNERVERCIISRIRRWDDFGAIDPSAGNSTFRQVYTFGY